MRTLPKLGGDLRRFNRYSAYKDSRVEWLGEIPEHWDTKRLKRVFRVVNGSTPQSAESQYWNGEVPWVTPDDLGDVTEAEIKKTRRCITEIGYRSCGTTLVPAGSLVLSTRAPIGHLAIAGVALCTNQGCRSLVFRADDSREYFFHQIVAARPELESLGQGSTFRELATGKLENIITVAPPADEQLAIAAFLDRETAKIDALVAKNERLIELLQQKRSALITRAVTKGLDPKVPEKDSGIEWLVKVPTHWEVRAVWSLFSLGRGRVMSHEEIHDHGGPYPVYSSQTENDGMMGLLDTYDFDGEYLTWTTDGAKAGTVFARHGRFNCTNVCGTLRATRANEIDLNFAREALNAATAWFVRHDINPKLMNNVMARIRIPVPPHAEQLAISKKLGCELGRIDALLASVGDVIERLKEFRVALISAAVTGQIDVREEAA